MVWRVLDHITGDCGQHVSIYKPVLEENQARLNTEHSLMVVKQETNRALFRSPNRMLYPFPIICFFVFLFV